MRFTDRQENVLYVRMLGGFSVQWNGKLIAGGSKSKNSQFENRLSPRIVTLSGMVMCFRS